ncbi:BTAD domain-containing putative transcriptional regulator [Phytohabitans sp. LJ34]|uniref:AfsR/SARP family transcriptional regulator n=1 Tax=Phytohabitans sp. LJ34 TaxID=3452217 RepID=UPI003F8B5721
MRATGVRGPADVSVTLHVGVLGPLDVRLDGRLVRVATGRLQALLAVLAMSAGRAVPPDRLATAVWGEEQPDHARRSVQLYVTRLRRTLGTAAIRTRADGYVLVADQVDALRFQGLLDAAAAAPDDAGERASLVAALALWRGAPFDGIRAAWLDRVEGPRLLDRYLAAVERRIDLDLAAGAEGEVVGQLWELTARHPLRERFWEQLMTALYRAGRQADALEAYRRLYRALADELGVAPGAGVRDLHRRILAGDPGLRGPAGRGVASAPVPRQLPAAIRGFSGRATSLAGLDAVARRADEATAIAVISGGGGVGKTTLAVHWAHRTAGQFPDGQLYVDLCGFGPSGHALRPVEAVRGFLEALGTPPTAVPTDLPAQVGLYRSLVAGKRVLVLLDNAADAEQVRPLLPGAPGSVAVVTTRHQLPGLVAEGAYPVTLDVLTDGEARELLAGRLGRDRVAAEPEATERILAICAGLPLALAIVAARATTSPRHGLAALAAELGEFRTCLDALASADAATDPRAVFSWSYCRLGPAAQRLFRLLSIHPGREVGALAAASLAGVPGASVRPVLAELCRAHLLTEHAPGRYSFHDLLRAYAAELLDDHDTAADRRAALRRLLDHFLGTAAAAALLIEPLRDPIAVVPPAPGVTAEPFGKREDALAWLDAERPALLGAVRLAGEGGFDAHAWQLAWSLADFLHWQGRWHDRVATLRTALAAAGRLGDHAEEARAHRCLGLTYTRLERYDEAHAHLRQALKLYLRLNDQVGQVRTHQSLSTVLERQGDHHSALRHAERAMELYAPAGSKAGLGRLLNSAGWCHAQVGDLRQALAHCERAAALAREAGDWVAEAATWDSLGYIRHRLGEHGPALAAYRHALDLRRMIGHRCGEANTLARIGDTQDAIGDRAGARASWRDALAILDDMGEPAANAVRAKLGVG